MTLASSMSCGSFLGVEAYIVGLLITGERRRLIVIVANWLPQSRFLQKSNLLDFLIYHYVLILKTTKNPIRTAHCVLIPLPPEFTA